MELHGKTTIQLFVRLRGKTTLTEDSACQRIGLHSISCFDCGDWRNCNNAFVDSAHVCLVKLCEIMVHASTWRSFPGKSKQRCQGYERYKRRRIGDLLATGQKYTA